MNKCFVCGGYKDVAQMKQMYCASDGWTWWCSACYVKKFVHGGYNFNLRRFR